MNSIEINPFYLRAWWKTSTYSFILLINENVNDINVQQSTIGSIE